MENAAEETITAKNLENIPPPPEPDGARDVTLADQAKNLKREILPKFMAELQDRFLNCWHGVPETVTSAYLNLAILIAETIPNCREQACALTDLENSLSWLSRGILRGR